jgi:hypothetical protein
MIFPRFEQNLVSKFYLKSVSIQTGPRGAFLLVNTGSAGLALWIVGLKEKGTHQICPYRFR